MALKVIAEEVVLLFKYDRLKPDALVKFQTV